MNRQRLAALHRERAELERSLARVSNAIADAMAEVANEDRVPTELEVRRAKKTADRLLSKT